MSNQTRTERRDIIEGAAGIYDKFELCAVDMQQYFLGKDQEKADKKNTKMATKKSVRREIISTELMQGMTIKTIERDDNVR